MFEKRLIFCTPHNIMNLRGAESEVITIRTGRPKAENPKEKSIKVRFDDASYERLEGYCKKVQQSKAEVIRACVEEKITREEEKSE